MLQLYKNIKNRRKELGMTQSELAKKLGYTDKSMISKIENGAIDLPQSKIIAFAPSDLMGWEDEPAKNTEALIKSIPNLMPLPYSSGRTVPLIGTIACGTPILAAENVEKEIQLPDNITADFCLRCKGDSMINARIHDGDIVYIKKQPMVENGQIGAVLIADTTDMAEATLKRVYVYDNKIMLVAENPQYQPLSFDRNDMNNVKIIGKAVAFLSGIK